MTRIALIYPPNDHQTSEASTFLNGQIVGGLPPGATLTCHQPESTLSQPIACIEATRGFFAHRVPLTVRQNPLVIMLKDGNGKLLSESRFTVTRLGAIEPAGPSPEWLWPQGEIKITSASGTSETLLVRLAVPANSGDWGIRLKSGSTLLAQNNAHRLAASSDPALWENRTGVFAHLHQVDRPRRAATIAESLLPLPASLFENAINHTLTLEAVDLAQPDRVFVYPEKIHLHHSPTEAQVTAQEAVTRTGPHDDAARLTPQPHGAWLWLNRQENGYARLAFTDTPIWVRLSDITPVKTTHSLTASSLRLIQERPRVSDPYTAEMLIPMAVIGPISWQVDPLNRQTHRVQLTLHHTLSACDFIHLAPDTPPWLGPVRWHSTGGSESTQGVTLDVLINRPLAGLITNITPDGLKLTLRVLPESPQELIIGLDAGHGGTELGAHAPDGTPEKDLNLRLTHASAEALKAAGFQVVFSRTTDETLSLNDRLTRLNQAKAHVVLSLHHNALPDGRDPTTERGFEAYYYHPWASVLARRLTQAMPGALGLPNHGTLYNSLAITRNPQALSLLIEAGFLTHPEDAARCVSAEFPSLFAQSLTQALTTWIASL